MLQSIDKVLEYFVLKTEQTGVGFEITLCVNGVVIQGKLIESKRYYDLMLQMLSPKLTLENITMEDRAKLDPIEIDILTEYHKDYQNQMRNMRRSTRTNRKYIHIENPRIMLSTSSNTIPIMMNIWRGKISSVNGFSLGSVEFQIERERETRKN